MVKARIVFQDQANEIIVELEDTNDYGLRSQLDTFLTWKEERDRSKAKENSRANSPSTDEDV